MDMIADHEHDWYLIETGYEGAGDEHLRCALCLATKPIPPGWEITYE